MASPEKDPERQLRVTKLMSEILSACEGSTIQDMQCAVGNAVARIALLHEDPEEVLLSTIESHIEIYRATRGFIREGKRPPPEIIN